MDYVKPVSQINLRDYDCVVSLGNKCSTTSILRKLNIYKESFPFDSIPTTPAHVLKYLKSQDTFYPQKDNINTKDGIWFGHFNVTNEHQKTIEMFKRRFERLFKLLKSKKKILFVYSAEGDMYNELNNRCNDNYNELLNIRNFITNTYKYDNFTIAAIHTNKTFKNEKNILNYTINVKDEFLSWDCSTKGERTKDAYVTVLERIFKDIFNV